jgi:tetratricopeptide (TPR) repeat protein
VDYDECFARSLKRAARLARRCKEDRERFDRGLEWAREKGGLLSDLSPAQSRSILPWIRVETLLQLAFEERYRDTAWMLDLAKHAQEVADRIESAPYGPAFIADLRTRAWTELANALRINEHYEQAEAAFWQARTILETGTGDPLLEARINELEASLWNTQQRQEKAQSLLKAANRIYLRLGEHHLAGRTLVSQGLSLRIAGKPHDAARACDRPGPDLSPTRHVGRGRARSALSGGCLPRANRHSGARGTGRAFPQSGPEQQHAPLRGLVNPG